ncbi:MAG: GNAT family protein [Deltaproteobacteria bacterium]|nr:GNAT family protein [Deltaproteobacteria bacterium]
MFRIPVDPTLDLVLLEPRHAPILFALIDENRAHLRRFLPWVDTTQSPQDSAVFIHSCLEQFARGTAVNVALFSGPALVGLCGTHAIHWGSRRAELGYWISSAWQGRGLMTRAVRALSAYLFFSHGLHRLEIRAASDNQKSRAVAERLGFVLEGTLREAEWLYDRYVDHALYAILQRDFQSS